MMIIIEAEGNVFDKAASLTRPVIAHGTNCRGVMGAGVAAGVRSKWPYVYDFYKRGCDADGMYPGMCWRITDINDGTEVFNLFTQDDIGADARIEAVASSVGAMSQQCAVLGITEVATVRLGCGIGGLSWDEVKPVLEGIDSDITLYVMRPVGTT